MQNKTIGFALCGSFCTLDAVLTQMQVLKDMGAEIIPIMSEAVYNTDTRFGTAESFRKRVTEITGNPIIHDITGAEPIGPRALLDLLLIAPCTGNTLGKLACGITDSCVTMAAKAHLRNSRPVVIAVSSNDSLAASAKNIGVLLGTKNYFFVPFCQDAPFSKPTSCVADFSYIPHTVGAALNGDQVQPIMI